MVGGLTFGAGILFFPISYVIGDVLTEVYGYARARRVIWAGFGALLFMAVMSWIVLAMPPAQDWWCSGTEALALKSGDASGTGAVCQEIGRASCRERVCQYVSISVVAV